MPDSVKGAVKKPRFFCENCGEEVPREGKKCPKCGRYFSSVRCPSCNFIGDDAGFKGGCPICGYSAPGTAGDSNGNSHGDPRSSNKNKRLAGALPLWVYIVTGTVFITIMAALFFRFF